MQFIVAEHHAARQLRRQITLTLDRKRAKTMGRITSVLVVMQLLVCCTSALGVDRWGTSFSPPSGNSRPTELASQSSTLGVSDASTAAFAFDFQTNPCDAQVSEFISTTTARLFGDTAPEAIQSEIAALIHPLSNPGSQPIQTHRELDLIRSTSFSAIHRVAESVSASFESSNRFLNPTIAGMTSPGDAAFGLSRFR